MIYFYLCLRLPSLRYGSQDVVVILDPPFTIYVRIAESDFC
jgi:hypothetical protein